MDPVLVDDIVPKRLHKDLENLFAGPGVEWFFNQDMTYSLMYKNLSKKLQNIILNEPNFVVTPGLSTPFVKGGVIENDTLFGYVQPITYLLEAHLHKHHPEILPEGRKLVVLRAKANLLFRNNTTKDQCELPHLDSISSDLNFVYYLNEADGDTFIFKEKVFDILISLL